MVTLPFDRTVAILHFTLVLGLVCQCPAETPILQTVADPALQQFQRAVVEYVGLRATLAKEIVGPSPNSTAAQITATSDGLARAVQRARPKPPPGAFFDAGAASALRGKIRELLAKNAALLEGLDDEVRPRTPDIYDRFPGSAPLSTMPPSLLAILPTLPPELEYRLVGEDLVLRDIAAAIVLDVLPKALPRE